MNIRKQAALFFTEIDNAKPVGLSDIKNSTIYSSEIFVKSRCLCLVEHDASSTWSGVNSIKLLQVFLQVYCKVNLMLVNTAWIVISVKDWLSSIQERTHPVMVLLGYFLWNKSSILAC